MSGSPAKISKVIKEHRSTGMPVREEMTLTRQQYSLYVTVMKDAWKDAGIDIENPGTVEQYYYPDEGFLVIDMGDANGD